MLLVRSLAKTRGFKLHRPSSSCLPTQKLFSSASDSNSRENDSADSNDTSKVGSSSSSAQKEVSTSGRFYAKFVKPIEWYDSRALDREYFYNVDLQGRLFLEETMPKNIATSLKSAKFLDFFFTQLRPNPSDGLYADEYPFISPCGKEMNFVRPFELRSPIVFYELTSPPTKTADAQDGVSESQISNTANESDHVLIYGATLQESFDPSALVMDTTEGRLFHRLMGHNHLSPARAHARMQRRKAKRQNRNAEQQNDQAEAQVEQAVEEEKHKDHLALIHSHLAISLSQSFVECEESSAGFAFEWQGKQYPISVLDDESSIPHSDSDDEDDDNDDESQSLPLKSESKSVLPPDREMFEPSHNWQPVLDHHVLPAGCEIRMDLSNGQKHAKVKRQSTIKYTMM